MNCVLIITIFKAIEQRLEMEQKDKEELAKMFPDRKISFADFKDIGNETLLRYYRNKDNSGVSFNIT